MVQSTIGSVFSEDDLLRHVAYILLELPLNAADLSQKLVPAPSWFRYDTMMSVARPPPWPD